ncbi:MAG: glucans biosynthesis glucosyltransferase MdoH, partial [Pseudomonadota bacterium]
MSQTLEPIAILDSQGATVRMLQRERQSMAQVARRRIATACALGVTYVALLSAVGYVLSYGGWSATDVALLTAFAIAAPWTVLGFWNALVGLSILHGTRDPMRVVAPFAAAGDAATPITARTAVLMTLRNEDPRRALSRLSIVKDSLDRTGHGQQFSYFVLSDTNDPDVAAAEEALVAEWQSEVGTGEAARITYRRRDENTGYKAGNVMDFCERWGRGFDFMLPLDADSLMSGETVVRLVRIMQAHRRIGILQSLVVGLPTKSAFARIFQFGMRHGMRAYTMGQAWWTADCGPFWGHNALVRVRPFAKHCRVPMLRGTPPLGGHVLSHDQVEATLMRRAGYEVRVLPEECGSWEENPPTILDFMQRDTRWCQGNLQYLQLLGMKGLKPLSRFQLAWAVLMFLAIPAWTLMIALSPFAAQEALAIPGFPVELAAMLYIGFLGMYLSPKLAGFLDVMLSQGGVARYGGSLRFAIGAMTELVFSFLQGAVSTIRTTIFMIGLLFGRAVRWSGQTRDAYGLPLSRAAAALWQQALFGCLVCGALYYVSPTTLIWSLPLTAGYLLAIPFASITASPSLGR